MDVASEQISRLLERHPLSGWFEVKLISTMDEAVVRKRYVEVFRQQPHSWPGNPSLAMYSWVELEAMGVNWGHPLPAGTIPDWMERSHRQRCARCSLQWRFLIPSAEHPELKPRDLSEALAVAPPIIPRTDPALDPQAERHTLTAWARRGVRILVDACTVSARYRRAFNRIPRRQKTTYVYSLAELQKLGVIG